MSLYNVDPNKMMMLPMTEFERLKDQIRELTRILEGHLYRDASVSEILSGSDVRWLCEKEIEDLREQVREGEIAQEANYELHKEKEELEARIVLLEIPVSKEEQIEIIRQAIRTGDL